MHDVKGRQQGRQCRTQRLVDRLRAQGAAHHQQHGLLAGEAQAFQACGSVTCEKLRAQGRADAFRLAAQHRGAFGEGGGDTLGEGRAELVGQAGGQVGLMAHHRDAVQPRAEHHRHGHKAALGEAHIGLDLAHQTGGLHRTREDAEGVGEVLPVEIATQLAGFDRVIGQAVDGGELLRLHALFRADVVDLIALFQQMGQQRQIRGDVTHRAAASEDDPFAHIMNPAFQVIFSAKHMINRPGKCVKCVGGLRPLYRAGLLF